MNFWVGPTHLQKPVDIMVPPAQLPSFKEFTKKLNLQSEIFISDVQK